MAKAKDITFVADAQRVKHKRELDNLSKRDLCEMVKAHFESHPALPGEADMKNIVNNALKDDNSELTDGQKKLIVDKFADTRIRETQMVPLPASDILIGTEPYDPSHTKRYFLASVKDDDVNKPVIVMGADIQLLNSSSGVYVAVTRDDGKQRMVGKLPDSFLTNNPMNVDACEAKLQITDFSGGDMKNVNTRVVVDTDLMSGDVVDLDDEMLNGLDQDCELAQ